MNTKVSRHWRELVERIKKKQSGRAEGSDGGGGKKGGGKMRCVLLHLTVCRCSMWERAGAQYTIFVGPA